jgi:type II secretory pathway pseudopilin PulG
MIKKNISKRRYGFTLVEVMVFSVVSLIFIGLLANVFITATRRTEDSRLRVDLQQTAIMIMHRFERDMGKTSLAALKAVDGPDYYALSITPAVTWNTNVGNPGAVWAKTPALYVYDKKRTSLHYETYSPMGSGSAEELSSRPYVPVSSELSALASTASGEERILSPHVEEFSLSDRSDHKTNFQKMPLKLKMKLRRPLSTSDRFAEFTVERRITLRNSF